MIQKEMLEALRAEFMKSLQNLESLERIPRLLIIGRKRTGKEELLDCLFGKTDEIEQEGNVTALKFRYVEVLLYDLEESDHYQSELPELLDSVDVLWYCSTGPLLLKKEWDFQVLLTLQQYCPTALVVTSLKGWMFSSRLKRLQIKLAEYYEGPVYPAYLKTGKRSDGKKEEDWSGLLTWSVSVLEDSLQGDFIASSENIDLLDEKRDFIVRKIIPSYASGAGVVGAVPIPFSDALLLVPEQVAMTVHILKIYGLEQSGRIVSGMIGSTLLSQIGRLTAGSLVKLIPGAGSITGGAVNGSVAASFTWALGMAVSGTAYRYKKAVASGLRMSFEEYFKGQDFKNLVE